MTQNYAPLTAQKTAENPEEPLLALVRLLARHAAEDTIKRTHAEQSANPKTLPTDTGATNDA